MTETLADASSATSARVIAVVVTYGDRAPLLLKVLRGLAGQAFIDRVIVVDNGATTPIEHVMSRMGGDVQLTVEIVAHGRNTGSAGGYASGIRAALRHEDCTHLFLLDDDNVPGEGCVRALIDLHRMAQTVGPTMICALRKGRTEYENLLSGASNSQIVQNSFLNFHIRELFAKTVRQLSGRKATKKAMPRPEVLRQIAFCAYGGLLLPAHLARATPGPREELVLYGDDNEYTCRLVAAGAQLLLTSLATITDVDVSWNEGLKRRNPWIERSAPAWRVYYSCRNRIEVEWHFVSSAFAYRLNQSVYTAVLFALALLEQRSLAAARKSLKPISDAIADARADRFGEHATYTIPQSRPRRPAVMDANTEAS